MHWRELLKGSELYYKEEKRDHFYDEYMKTKDWPAWDGPELPDSEVRLLFTFLNQWSTHYPSGPEAVIAFKEAYRIVFPKLQAIGHTKLEEADLTVSTSEQVKDIFEKVASCGARYEATGASKILHAIAPQFFVMWDANICSGYAVYGTAHEYAYKFLPRIQKQIHEAIRSYMADFAFGQKNAAKELCQKGGGKPLTKLVDEYNYAKFTLRLDELWDC